MLNVKCQLLDDVGAADGEGLAVRLGRLVDGIGDDSIITSALDVLSSNVLL